MKNEEETEVNTYLTEMESLKDNSTKFHSALRSLNNRMPKKPLIVKNENGEIAGSDDGQAKIVTTHFKKMLAPEQYFKNFENYPAHEMSKPFTCEEIGKAVKSLKNGKSSGIDNINAELIKYAGKETHEAIAEIYNETAKSGVFPKELVHGILTPLQKPGKKKGPLENLRPIILLSLLRTILTICILRRVWDRLSKRIPQNQAAYQPGRSTTEQVFAIKILVEKAITSNDYSVHLLLLDMYKSL